MARYFLNIGTDTNSTANWSNASGGAGGFSVPTSTDDVFFDANSGPATLTANMSVKTLTFTGYASTITMPFNITASGSVTLDTTMTVAGAGTLFVNATATITSNGKTWGNPMSFTNTITITVVGDLYVAGTVTTTTQTFNGSAIYCTTSLSVTGSMVAGTSNFHLNGTGTWSGAGTLRNNLLIDSTANIILSGTVAFSTGTLTVDPAATVVTTGSTLNINGSCTLDTSSVSWNNITETLATTITNTSAVHVYGTFTHVNGGSTWNGSDVYLYGSLTLVNGNIGNGTSTFIYKGSSGVWSATNGLMRANFTIHALSSLTISGTVRYNLGYLYFDPLSNVVSTGSVLTLDTSTISTNGIVLNSILVNTTSALTINSKLLATTLTISNAAVAFGGLAGFKVNNYVLTTPTANRAISYKNGLEYEVDNLFESNGTSTNKYTFTSDSGTLKALFTLAYGATQSVKNTNATRIDSSNGQTINASLASVLTDTINWQLTEGNWWLVLNRA